MDKFHPGYFGKVGMKRYHRKAALTHMPTINIDRLWGFVPKEIYENASDSSAPVIAKEQFNLSGHAADSASTSGLKPQEVQKLMSSFRRPF